MNISENCKVVLAKAAATAATSAVASDVIDTAGYTDVVIIGWMDAAADNTVCVAQTNAANGSGGVDLAGTKLTNKSYFKIGVVRPSKRYLIVKIARGTSKATGQIWAILSNSRKAPVTSATVTLTEALHVSPAEGTA